MHLRYEANPPKRAKRLLLSCSVLVIILGFVALIGQTLHPIWRVGHDQYELIPIHDWNFGTGFWDGQDPQTRQGVGGCIFSYGFLERMTNISPSPRHGSDFARQITASIYRQSWQRVRCMKLLILHIIVYSLIYLLSGMVYLGLMGVINYFFHKPFLFQWRERLSWFAIMLLIGFLVDLVPGKFLLIVGVPAGLVLLAGVIWVFVKYPREITLLRKQANQHAK